MRLDSARRPRFSSYNRESAARCAVLAVPFRRQGIGANQSMRLSIHWRAAAGIALFLAAPGGRLAAADDSARLDAGTYRGRILTDRFMRRQRLAREPRSGQIAKAAAPAPRRDVGDIAVIDTSNGVVADPNFFDLAGANLLFTPSANGYSITPGNSGLGGEALGNGLPLTLGDDDFREVRLPFAFPYFGKTHDVVFVHSDGNLTFEEPDARSTGRNFARAFAGPPRILPLFTDLDPSKTGAAVSIAAAADRAAVSWRAVPLFRDSGIGARQTFHAVLFADGRIAFRYDSTAVVGAVVGVFPGRLEGEPAPADMSLGLDEPAAGGAAEIFTSRREIDCFAASQQFFRSHDDVYDFLVFFNDIGLANDPGSFAFEVNVRNETRGIGDLLFADPVFDFGVDFGSPRRLSSFLNMGPLSNYPRDPEARIPLLGENSTLSVLGHETGHRFLAYPAFLDPETGLRSPGLLGRQMAHWSFFFNSQASFVEGNLIEDKGQAESPRFLTIETVSRFSELDQYLMGLRAPEEVSATFLVENPYNGVGFGSASRAPQTGVAFDGERKNVTLDRIVAAEGPRLPAHTVAQREFRFAFIMVVEEGSEPDPASTAKLDDIRGRWPAFYAQATDGRSTARTELVKLLHLSTWPAGGVVVGRAGKAHVEIAEPLAVDLAVRLTLPEGLLRIPSTVTIPAGKLRAAFDLESAAPGLATLVAEAGEPGFDRAVTRVQARDRLDALKLEAVSGGGQTAATGSPLPEPVVFRVADRNFTPYSGVPLRFEASGGLLFAAQAETDALGRAEAGWRSSGPPGAHTLTARLRDEPSVSAVAQVRVVDAPPRFSAAGVVNAASFETAGAGFAPGSLLTIFGEGLAAGVGAAAAFPLPDELESARVLVNGVPAPLLFVNPGQINFQLPFAVRGENFMLTAATAAAGDRVELALAPAQPGIFFDPASGIGAIVPRGGAIEIYATGLGAVSPSVRAGEPAPAAPLARVAGEVRAWVDGVEAPVAFAGLAPFTAGLYQVNAALPGDPAPGRRTAAIAVDGRKSNEVFFDTN